MYIAIKHQLSTLTTFCYCYLSFWCHGLAFSEVPAQQQDLHLSTLGPFSAVQLVNCISSAG